jgi:FdrA protein
MEDQVKKVFVEKDSYHDSVFLMLTSKEVKGFPGVSEAVVVMATEMNLDLLSRLGFAASETEGATPNDLVIGVIGDSEETVSGAILAARQLLGRKSSETAGKGEHRPASLDAALREVPEANLAVISLPGEYAAREAHKALQRGLHVMLFSDNVSIEDEIRLKKLASEEGLLVMGPDCGTAILNGKPICFANAVRRGNIGVVAAAGTGLQEITCCIDRLGGGISQAIGTGGRDCADVRVGGATMLMGIEALSRDPGTAVIAVVSKPPAPEVAERVLEALGRSGKPSVVDFIGIRGRKGTETLSFAESLEEAAGMAVASSSGKAYTPHTFDLPEKEIGRLVRRETSSMAKSQRFLRGLFTGGTLADEALYLLDGELGGIHSNVQKKKALILKDPHSSRGHTIVDLGDDAFTVGRPHPMIDPSLREERIAREAEDPEVAILLLDVVLGYGSHPNPAGAVIECVKKAKSAAASRGGYLAVITSITGTAGDFQDMAAQRLILEQAGCVVMPSNCQAAMLSLKILTGR